MSKKYHIAHNTMLEAVNLALKKTYVPSGVKAKAATGVKKDAASKSSHSLTVRSHKSVGRKANNTKRK